MAGHSKWAQIKRKKAVTDARRGQLWTRVLKEIAVAARLGGGDPAGNPRLRSAIQEAKSSNVPNDNIDRAIKRGTGELEGIAYEELTYEGYAPGGVAVLIEAVTDNKNRTVAELRHLFSKHGGSLGESGCVAWMFHQRGYLALERTAIAEDRLMELALELGAEDFALEEDVFELYTQPEDYPRILDEVRRRELPLAQHELAMEPHSLVEVEADQANQVMRLLEAIEEHDDVQNVWANFDIDEEALALPAD